MDTDQLPTTSFEQDLVDAVLEWWEQEGTGEAPHMVRLAMHSKGGRWGSGPWWCCECNRLVESTEVTYEETHDGCGGICS